MGIDTIRALLDGFRRVLSAPMLLFGMYVLTPAASLHMGFVLFEAISLCLGSTTATVPFGIDWWRESPQVVTWFARTLLPEMLSVSTALTTLSEGPDISPTGGVIVSLVFSYLLVWAFLLGGIIDRLARQRRVGSEGFFAACGLYFWRFIRLAILSGTMCWLAAEALRAWLFGHDFSASNGDTYIEQEVTIVHFVLYSIFGMILIAVALVFDYAKIRTVVEDRRSIIGSIVAGVRFVRRRLVSAVSLYLLNVFLFATLLITYAIVAPSVGSDGFVTWSGFFVGQAYVAARLYTKLVFYASETAYFQSQLAHATYVAHPQPRMPESPLVEAIVTTPRQS